MSQRLGRSYRRLLAGYTISNVGNGILVAAFPLLVASTTRNPVVISGLTVAAGLPWILVGPLSGTIVDRVERRGLMVLAEAGRAVVMGVAALYVFMGGESIVVLYAFLLLIGIGETLFDPAGLALVPGLVTPAQLDIANSWLFGTQTLAQRFAGPALGGWLFAYAAWAPVGVDAVCFLTAAIVVVGLPRGGKERLSEDRGAGLLAETLEGLRWVWTDGVLRAFVIGSGTLHFATAASLSVFVLIAQDRFGLTGFGFGLTLSALAVGYFLGYIAAPPIAMKLPRWRICVAAVLVVASGFSLVGFSRVALIGGLGLAVVGFATAQIDVVAMSYRQAAVPDRILGRVLAGFLFVVHGAVPIGAIFGGLVAAWAGIGYTYMASALSAAAVAPYLWFTLKDAVLDPRRVQRGTSDS